MYLVLERWEGREKKRERNTDVREIPQSVGYLTPPTGGPGPQPRHVP